MVAESKWVQARRIMVNEFIDGVMTTERLWENRDLAVRTLLAMRDEVKYLREKLAEKETPDGSS